MSNEQLRLVTYTSAQEYRLGVLKDDGVVDLESAAREHGFSLPHDMLEFIRLGDKGLDAAREAVRSARTVRLDSVVLGAPIPELHKNVFAVGRNYAEHVTESARGRGVAVELPEQVVFFTKPPTSVIGHEQDIRLDATVTTQLDYEVELVVVIGSGGRNIPAAQAWKHIYGYTVGNDVSARDVQSAHLQWFKGKALDTTCPIGPCIVPSRDLPSVEDLGLTLRVNGESRQASRTSMMIFDLPTIIEQLSRGMTLEPGDLIMTGTPSGIGHRMSPPRYLQPGDVIEAEIEGIGILRNRVAAY